MERLIHDLNERADAASTVVKFLKRSFSEIERRQKNLDSARESVAEKMMEIDTLRESYENGLKDLEEKELDFCTFKEGKKRKLALEEDDLSVKREELLNDVRMREEKMKEQLVGLSEKIDFMEMGHRSMHQRVEEKLKEIEAKKERLDSAWDSLAERERKINIIERKMHKQVGLVVKKENELNSRVERKMKEIALKEEELDLRWKDFIKEVKAADERFLEKQKLRERLEMAENKAECLVAVVNKSFKKIEARESAVLASLAESGKQSDLIGELMEKELEEFEKLRGKFLIYHDVKMEELVSKECELDSKCAELEKKEDSLISKEIQLEEKLKKLQSWDKELEVTQVEVELMQELNQSRLEEFEQKEKSLNSVREEHIAIMKQLLLEKDLSKRREKDLDLSDSVDIKFILSMDGKTLQMFLNDPEKDLESMGDEIFQVLHLSLDPAKLILDAMVGFYPPYLRKDDVEVDVRRTCIVLLKQLSKMTKIIQPNIGKEAIELASSWKSKMGASGEDPLEVMGFLHLLAAYNLASHFDKDEILSFLKIADQLGQRPLLFRDFGFEDSFTDSTVEVESQPASEEAKT